MGVEAFMGRQSQEARLEALLSEWPGLMATPHHLGGVDFRVGRREVGHVHPNGTLDVPFPVRMRRELVAAGRAEAHHMLPHSGWVTFRIRNEHDLPAAIALLRMNYDRLLGAHARTNLSPLVGKVTMVRGRGEEDLAI